MLIEKKIGKIQWLDIQDPNEKDFELLEKKYDFHPLDIDDCRSKLQRPKIEFYKSYRFAILQVPMTQKTRKQTSIVEIDVFWEDNFIVTVHEGDIPEIPELIEELQKKNKKRSLNTINGKKLFFELSNKLISQIFPLLNQFRRTIDRIDKNMFSLNSREVVEDINAIRRTLILSQTNIRQLITIFKLLETKTEESADPLAIYWGEILDKLYKIKDEFEDFQEITEGLNNSLESIVNHRTNEIMKTLTIFMAIMLPLTLITGFYGMNIDHLPFAHSVNSLTTISFSMIAITVLMIMYFKNKKWF